MQDDCVMTLQFGDAAGDIVQVDLSPRDDGFDCRQRQLCVVGVLPRG